MRVAVGSSACFAEDAETLIPAKDRKTRGSQMLTRKAEMWRITAGEAYLLGNATLAETAPQSLLTS